MNYVIQNGLEKMVFGGVLNNVIYESDKVKIDITGNKCIDNNLVIMDNKIPFIIVVEKKENGRLRRLNTLYTFLELKDLFTQWYGKRIEVYVYNNTINTDSFSREELDYLNQLQKQNWFVFSVLKSSFLNKSLLGKVLISLTDIYPVVGVKVYD